MDHQDGQPVDVSMVDGLNASVASKYPPPPNAVPR
jgi:hypothetical protein